MHRKFIHTLNESTNSKSHSNSWNDEESNGVQMFRGKRKVCLCASYPIWLKQNENLFSISRKYLFRRFEMIPRNWTFMQITWIEWGSFHKQLAIRQINVIRSKLLLWMEIVMFSVQILLLNHFTRINENHMESPAEKTNHKYVVMEQYRLSSMRNGIEINQSAECTQPLV